MDAKQPYRPREHLDYPRLTMFQMVERMAAAAPASPAYEFYGKKTSYAAFLARIRRAARALQALGIRRGDAVTICMPNVPQALDAFYAVSCLGAVANMVHPQSAQKEITWYLDLSGSKALLTLDLFYEKAAAARAESRNKPVILTARMQDELPLPLAAAFLLKKGKALLKFPQAPDRLWSRELKNAPADAPLPEPVYDETVTAAILYSGGTSGDPKGICLTDRNFNALALQAAEAIGVPLGPGSTMLSCMPLFHGFGLGINLHTILVHGACCILMPTFNAKSYGDMLRKKRPNFIAGVPTIFEALLHLPQLEGLDMGFLKGMFCGGDCLSVELKKKLDAFLADHGAAIQVREGYGLTECVTASCLTPRDDYRPGSIGLPFPDTVYRIRKPDTDELLPPGEEGEIILRGPTVMLGYLNDPEETARTLRRFPDGQVWLCTGDLGHMDGDGFVYFHQRLKRMIITNGYNVYPSRLENVIDSVPEVAYSCVIGVPDPRRMHRVKAYVVLRDGYAGSDALRDKIMAALAHEIAAYALPKELVFRPQLPKTLVGKVDYRKLEQESEEEAANG